MRSITLKPTALTVFGIDFKVIVTTVAWWKFWCIQLWLASANSSLAPRL